MPALSGTLRFCSVRQVRCGFSVSLTTPVADIYIFTPTQLLSLLLLSVREGSGRWIGEEMIDLRRSKLNEVPEALA